MTDTPGVKTGLRSYSSDAYLGHAIYAGQGQWGHEFIDYKDREDEDPIVYRVKEPECVLIQKEEH